jgi:FKBP-type peptidyl-prolyl cis-trans isomerase SlyD
VAAAGDSPAAAAIAGNPMARAIGLLSVLAWFAAFSGALAQAPASAPIGNGSKVTVEYTVTLPDQTVAETTVGQEPVTYVQGHEEILPKLEQALAGMTAGQTKRVTLSADEAYGQYDAGKKVAVPKDRMPADIAVGTRLMGSDGQEAKVAAIEGDKVIVDTNHPLAGKSLTFEVRILKVEQEK